MSTKPSKPVYLFYGENTFASFQKVQTWKAAFNKKYQDNINLEVLDGKKIQLSQFITDIEAIPFLCEKRLIIVKDFLKARNAEDQKKVSAAIDKLEDFTILVFYEGETVDKRGSLYKKIKKIGQVEEFKAPTQLEVNRWITQEAKKNSLNIDIKTANHLSTHCGTNLWNLKNELQKLKVYANGSPITTKMIDDLTTPSLSASVFKLTDKIAEKRTKEALSILKIIEDNGEDLIRVFFMIVRQFRIIIQVWDMQSRNETKNSITKKLKQPPFVIQKAQSQSRNFNLPKLEQIYKHLLQIDTDFKTGKIRVSQKDNSEYKLAIEKFIIECCS